MLSCLCIIKQSIWLIMIPLLWMPDGTDFWSQYSYDKLICRKCQAITGSAYPFVPL